MSSKLQSRVSALVGKPLFWVVMIAILLGWPIVRSVRTQLPGRLPELGEIPEFTFTNHLKQSIGTKDLKGRVWVANFIFTRCPTICPKLTERMANVQHRSRNVAQAFRMISFTVDPENDTPEVLAEYATKHRASPSRWHFLTGDLEDLRQVIVKGFKIAMGTRGPRKNPNNIFHGSHIVLVDGNLKIRGYYEAVDDEALKKLMRDVGLLIARGG